mmetsp:Transcript_6842/g.22414  ORF Transcript_6842/g.22414 Transcript_6842/m.22414 type:complete len:510 (+) Transcript_6842:2301-3830(+)
MRGGGVRCRPGKRNRRGVAFGGGRASPGAACRNPRGVRRRNRLPRHWPRPVADAVPLAQRSRRQPRHPAGAGTAGGRGAGLPRLLLVADAMGGRATHRPGGLPGRVRRLGRRLGRAGGAPVAADARPRPHRRARHPRRRAHARARRTARLLRHHAARPGAVQILARYDDGRRLAPFLPADVPVDAGLRRLDGARGVGRIAHLRCGAASHRLGLRRGAALLLLLVARAQAHRGGHPRPPAVARGVLPRRLAHHSRLRRPPTLRRAVRGGPRREPAGFAHLGTGQLLAGAAARAAGLAHLGRRRGARLCTQHRGRPRAGRGRPARRGRSRHRRTRPDTRAAGDADAQLVGAAGVRGGGAPHLGGAAEVVPGAGARARVGAPTARLGPARAACGRRLAGQPPGRQRACAAQREAAVPRRPAASAQGHLSHHRAGREGGRGRPHGIGKVFSGTGHHTTGGATAAQRGNRAGRCGRVRLATPVPPRVGCCHPAGAGTLLRYGAGQPGSQGRLAR